MNRTLRYLILIPLSVLAFYLLFVLPDMDLGWIGGLAMLAGAWLVWYLLWATIRESAEAAADDGGDNTASPGEQCAWVGLLFTLAILLYYALHGAQMVAPDGSRAAASSQIGTHIGYLVIAWLVVMQVLRHRWRDKVETDERDRAIQARATVWSRGGLVVFIIGMAVMLAFSPLERLRWAGPMVLSNMLMMGLIASSALEYLVSGISYLRDRLAVVE